MMTLKELMEFGSLLDFMITIKGFWGGCGWLRQCLDFMPYLIEGVLAPPRTRNNIGPNKSRRTLEICSLCQRKASES